MEPSSEPEETKTKRATTTRVVGVVAGLVLITIGTLAEPRLGNYAMLFTLLGMSVAVIAFVSASARIK